VAKTLKKLAEASGFGKGAKLLETFALPAVGFSLSPQRDCPVGSSRLGGGPDVTGDFEWPEDGGRRLDFVLQLNLADVAAVDPATTLPRSGLLSFFYDMEHQPWGFDPKQLSGHAVRYFPDPSALHRVPAPDDEVALAEAALAFWPTRTLPYFGSRAWDRLQKALKSKHGKKIDFDALDQLSEDLWEAASPGEDAPLHWIGGNSANVQGDMQLEAQLVMNGLYCGDSSGYHDPRAAKLEKTCEEWSLLLQLDSDDEGGFMWGVVGRLFFWIRDSDLARGDFSRVWMTLQCS